MRDIPTDKAFVFPASFSQEQIWLLDQLDPGDPSYNLAAAVRLLGRLDVSALNRSLNAVVDRHESLRTVFGVIEGRITQVIRPKVEIDIPILSITEFDIGDAEQTIVRCGRNISQRRFDLSLGPLIHAVLLANTPEDHAFFFNVHHIVADGWSTTIIIRELMEFYKAFTAGENLCLSPLPVQFADFSEWQRKCLTDAIVAVESKYWKQKLEGVSALDLPTDYSRPPILGHNGGKLTLTLTHEISLILKQLSQQESATLFMVLLASFELLLHRHTGSIDIVIGSPVSGRIRPQIENVIGCFVNTLILRTDVSGDPTFVDFLSRIRAETLDAHNHAGFPFEKVLHELNPERGPSHAPLFQVLFNMLNFPSLDFELPGLEVKPIDMPEIRSKFDLTMYVEEKKNGIVCDVVYNSELFRAERISEMLRQFELILKQIAIDPKRRISSISLLTDEARLLLPDPKTSFNPGWGGSGSVQQLFLEQVRAHPTATAVVSSFLTWTYEELNWRSNQLANHLLESGIQPEEVVAIYAHRSPSLVCALIGILKAGASFLILDPSYPEIRLLEYIKIASPSAWLRLDSAAPTYASVQAYIDQLPLKARFDLLASVDTGLGGELGQYSTNDPGVPVSPDSLAYVSFTSGSSGVPKAVLGRHSSLSHSVSWFQREFLLGSGDHFAVLSALSHDPLHRDIFLPLMLGARVCFPEPEALQAPKETLLWMRQDAITVANLTPASGRVLLEGKFNSGSTLDELRYVFFVGDTLRLEDIEGVQGLAPGATCVNLYGTTETQQALSFLKVHRSDAAVGDNCYRKEILPLGKGIKDVQLLVVNGSQQAGIGETGEIYFHSPHMAMGYKDAPELSHKKFVKNWFTGRSEDRLYRTGDLGRYLPDGSVEYLGRADQQVKVRGFRIELGEIEASLKQHSNVKEAATMFHEYNPGDRQIVAYVVLDDHSQGWEDELRKHLAQRLPYYMTPSAFVCIDAIPLTTNGKLDRRALPVPERNTGRTVPRTILELELTVILQEVLDVPCVGLHDNFFRLGGHSLLAIQFLARLELEFGVAISFQQFYRDPTVSTLIPLIVQGQIQNCNPETAGEILSQLEQRA